MNIIISISFVFTFIFLNLISKNYFKLKSKFLELNFFIIFNLFFSSIVFYLVVFQFELQIIKLIIYFVCLLLLMSFFLYFLKSKPNISKYKFDLKLSDKFIYIYILISFIYINLPIIDADSLRYHLLIGKKILNNNFYNNITLDYIYIGNAEIIGFIGQVLQSQHLISLFNFFGLILVYCLNKDLKKNYNFGYGNVSTVITFSLFFLLSNLYSQKIYFILCIITVYSAIYLLHQKNINFFSSCCFFCLNLFVILSKQSFLFFFILNCLLILFKLKRADILKFIIFSIFLTTILFYPNLYFKKLLFDEPFLPFILIKDNEILKNFINYVFDYGTNVSDLFTLEFYKNSISLKNIFSPTNVPFGFAILLLFFCIKSEVKFKYLLYFFLIFVFITGNIQMRWFLPAIILSSLIFNIKNNKLRLLFNYMFVIQKIIVLLIMTIYVSTYFYDKSKYLNKFYYGQNLLKKLKKFPSNINLITDLEIDYHLNNHSSIYKIYSFSKLKNNNIFYHLKRGQNYLLVSSDNNKINNFINNHKKILNIYLVEKHSITTFYRNPFVKDKLIYNFVQFNVN